MDKNKVLENLADMMYEEYVPDNFKRNDELIWISKNMTKDIVENSFSSLILKVESLEKQLEETKKLLNTPMGL